MKFLVYVSHLLFLVLPGSVEDYLLINFYGFRYPILTLILPIIYFKDIFKNKITLFFTGVFILLSFIISFYHEENTGIMILYTYLVFSFDYKFTKSNLKWYKILILISLLIIIFQLIFQFLGLYRVDYGNNILSIGFHTTAGDPNFSGFIIAFFGYVYLKLSKNHRILNYAFLTLLIFSIILTESRGAALLLIPSVLTTIQFFQLSFIRRIFTVSFLVIVFYLFIFQFNSYFSKWQVTFESFTLEGVSSGRNYRIEDSFEYSNFFTLFNFKADIVPYHFMLNDPIFSPHNFYISTILSFGLTGFLIIIFFMKKFFLGFNTKDYDHKIFLFLIFFIVANIESYFLNVYVLYLMMPWLCFDQIKFKEHNTLASKLYL